MRVGGRRGRDTPEEAASKALSRLLRHEAGTPECPISPEGWVRWRDLLNHPRCRDHREDLLEWGVHNSKDRFVAKQDTDGVWFAAAWSGHTIAGVTGPSREVDYYDTPQINGAWHIPPMCAVYQEAGDSLHGQRHPSAEPGGARLPLEKGPRG